MITNCPFFGVLCAYSVPDFKIRSFMDSQPCRADDNGMLRTHDQPVLPTV